MQISKLPDGMEQLPDGEVLACTIAHMLHEGIEACQVSNLNEKTITISDMSLMLCDVLRSQRLGVPVTPATKAAMNSMTVDLAIFRAMNRPKVV